MCCSAVIAVQGRAQRCPALLKPSASSPCTPGAGGNPCAAAGHLSLFLELLSNYKSILRMVLDLPAYQPHAQAIAASSRTQHAVAGLLLRQALPSAAAAMEAGVQLQAEVQQAAGSTARESGSSSGGHRRVCKALAAERKAAKEQQEQA
jgi:hypothetical protein